MLKLTRKLDQIVLLHVPSGLLTDITVEVKVVGIDSGGTIRLGFNAPPEVAVVRPEINSRERNDRSAIPDEAIIKELFHECWKQGQGFAGYDKPKWMELQAALARKGISV